jgi:hypothetical protein
VVKLCKWQKVRLAGNHFSQKEENQAIIPSRMTEMLKARPFLQTVGRHVVEALEGREKIFRSGVI